jgi:hypothetical protein
MALQRAHPDALLRDIRGLFVLARPQGCLDLGERRKVIAHVCEHVFAHHRREFNRLAGVGGRGERDQTEQRE